MKKQDQFETRLDKFANNISGIRTWTGLKTKKILTWPDTVRFPNIGPRQLKSEITDREWN